MPDLQAKFIWFEHISPDLAAARRFYSELPGWKPDPAQTGIMRGDV
jgi:predicted enzyme related to lactoylglutathione lyase